MVLSQCIKLKKKLSVHQTAHKKTVAFFLEMSSINIENKSAKKLLRATVESTL